MKTKTVNNLDNNKAAVKEYVRKRSIGPDRQNLIIDEMCKHLDSYNDRRLYVEEGRVSVELDSLFIDAVKKFPLKSTDKGYVHAFGEKMYSMPGRNGSRVDIRGE